MRFNRQHFAAGLRRKAAGLVFVAGILFSSFAEGIEGFEFVNRDIDEILFSVSMFEGVSIVCDDTVSGKATFRFAGNDFDSAFESFLKSQRLFVEKKNDVWTVSRVNFSTDGERIILNALDVKPQRLVEKITSYFGTEVCYEVLPENPVTVYAAGTESEDFVRALVRQLGKSYELVEEDGVYNITRVNVSPAVRFETSTAKLNVSYDSLQGVYSVDAADCIASNILEEFFGLQDTQFVFVADASFPIKRMKFEGTDFYQTLTLLCDNSSLAWMEQDDIVYIFSADTSRTQMLLDYGKSWVNYELIYLSPEECASKVCQQLGNVRWIKIDEKTISFFSDEASIEKINSLVSALDVKQDYYIVTLKYISTDDFLAHLPPGIDSTDLKKTTRDDTLFFTGTQGMYQYLCESLKDIDVPVKRLSYDLLVMQYQYSGEETWESCLAGNTMDFGDATNASLMLGSVLSFNLDVVAAFGYKFALSLQGALDENKAHVFADTKLHGVNGRKISFKNTSTYRYRDSNINPETGAALYSGITREIVSGLTIDVTGWVSGDGMITSSITASVSRQGVDTSSKTGNPPPTSEKIITTEVRGKSGEVIVLSGLIQNEDSSSSEGIPFISKIPVLGKLFSSGNKGSQKTELVIYLVPHWLEDEIQFEEENPLDFCNRLASEFVELYGNTGDGENE